MLSKRFLPVFVALIMFIFTGSGCGTSEDRLVKSLIKQLKGKSWTYYYLEYVGNERYAIKKRSTFSDMKPVSDAAECLGYLGQKARVAVPVLIWALNNYSDSVGGDGGSPDQSSVAKALGCIGDTRAIPPLLSILRSNNPGNLSAAKDIFYLPNCSVKARLSNGTIARALGMFGPDAKIAAPELVMIIKERLDEDNKNVLIERLISLCKDQKSDPGYSIIVKKNVEFRYDDDRIGAAEALGKLKELTSIQPLIELLDDSSPGCVRAAAEALGEFGPKAKEALPHLRNLLSTFSQDKDRSVKYSIQEAIKKIDR